jgi:hypothetical protein
MSTTFVSEVSPNGGTKTITTTVTPVATVTTTTIVEPHLKPHQPLALTDAIAAAALTLDTKKQDKEAFVGLFPSLVEDIITEVQSFQDYDEGAIAWFKEVRHDNTEPFSPNDFSVTCSQYLFCYLLRCSCPVVVAGVQLPRRCVSHDTGHISAT